MNLNQALRKKNVLVREINKCQQKIKKHNSFSTDECPFDLNAQYNELSEKIAELSDLKSKIAKANTPINEKIYKISEYKSLIKFWKDVPTINGKIESINYRSSVDVAGDYKTFFSVNEIDAFITKLEENIETLQSELEVFNATTQI